MDWCSAVNKRCFLDSADTEIFGWVWGWRKGRRRAKVQKTTADQIPLRSGCISPSLTTQLFSHPPVSFFHFSITPSVRRPLESQCNVILLSFLFPRSIISPLSHPFCSPSISQMSLCPTGSLVRKHPGQKMTAGLLGWDQIKRFSLLLALGALSVTAADSRTVFISADISRKHFLSLKCYQSVKYFTQYLLDLTWILVQTFMNLWPVLSPNFQ